MTPLMQSYCDKMVQVPMYGSVRSLNCATTSGIFMSRFRDQISMITQKPTKIGARFFILVGRL